MKSSAVIVPPVITPAEVPAGAFMLASGLMARGVEAPVHDLSLGFFRWLFLEHAPSAGLPNCSPSLDYLVNPGTSAYDPHRHRSVCGVLQSALKRYSRGFPGWQLSLMDCVPPGAVHSAEELAAATRNAETPFSVFFSRWLAHHGDTFSRALISLSYISQLPGAMELSHLLEGAGKQVIVGGSLPSALASTGRGIGILRECFTDLRTDDGGSLTGTGEPLLSRMEWPLFGLEQEYLSHKYFIPFPLTTGCVWNRCLFCPDRDKEYLEITGDNLVGLLEKAPKDPVVHLIDSAVPIHRLKELLPVFREMTGGFYGFARPGHELLEKGLPESLKRAGCLMLQTGVESGSGRILKDYIKGFTPAAAEQAVKNLHGAGIQNYVYLLFGLPGETDADRNLTLEMMRRLGRDVDYLNISVFNLPERSELTDRAEEFGIEPGEYDPSSEVLRFYRPFRCSDGTNPREEAREYLRGVFKTDPAVEGILQRTPKWFRAGHMAIMRSSG